RSVEREAWAQAFGALAAPHEARAAQAEAQGDAETARREYLIAYDCYHVARYPAPNSPGKLAAYRKSQELFHKAARTFDPPLERIEMPFRARPGEGKASIGLLRKPKAIERPPVVVLWGGIDAFKEERATEAYLNAGLAALGVDMPGVADAPLAGSQDAERLWDAIFDYIATRADLDSERVAIHGGSTGGYWATKLAHTHAARLRAAVNQGGPAHWAFQKDWIVKAQRGEYPFELAETHACRMDRVRAAALAARAANSRRAVRAAAVRQRHRRHGLSDRGHASAARARKSQVRALLPRRPYGRFRRAGGDRRVAQGKIALRSKRRVSGAGPGAGAGGRDPAAPDFAGSGPEANRCAAGAAGSRSAAAGAAGRSRAEFG